MRKVFKFIIYVIIIIGVFISVMGVTNIYKSKKFEEEKLEEAKAIIEQSQKGGGNKEGKEGGKSNKVKANQEEDIKTGKYHKGYLNERDKGENIKRVNEAEGYIKDKSNHKYGKDGTGNKSHKSNLDWGTRGKFKPTFGDAIGILYIDKLNTQIPIVEGIDEKDLLKGVGHYEGTPFPSDEGQVVLSGHRDTVFRRIGELGKGDVLTVQMPYGKFKYKIYETKVVDAEDRTIIVPHDEEKLTVTTCYPFRYIGNAPDRYIINAKPVK